MAHLYRGTTKESLKIYGFIVETSLSWMDYSTLWVENPLYKLKLLILWIALNSSLANVFHSLDKDLTFFRLNSPAS